MTFGVTELLIVLGIVLLLFGSTKLPKLARSFGQAQREFQRGHDDPIDSAETIEAPTITEANRLE